MKRAIELAKNAIRSAYPNPAVGCVIVHQNTIIGEGFTSPYGGAHAEVNAIANVEDKSLLSSSELYVTLEPCSHFGKTPPCANLIIEHKIPKIYIGLKDPNPQVAGKGIAMLEDHNIKVTQGVLEEQCSNHHRKFLCFQKNKRPYIILKWAETKDGFIAPNKDKRSTNAEPFWISSKATKTRVHLWRSKEHGILIGANTLRDDNPSLNVRLVNGMSPIPIVLDPHLSIKPKHQLYSNPDLIVIVDKKTKINSDYPFHIQTINFSSDVITQLMSELHNLKILSVLVEGGAYTLNEFIRSGIWDQARVIQSKNTFKEGIKAPVLQIDPVAIKTIDVDQISYYNNESDG